MAGPPEARVAGKWRRLVDSALEMMVYIYILLFLVVIAAALIQLLGNSQQLMPTSPCPSNNPHCSLSPGTPALVAPSLRPSLPPPCERDNPDCSLPPDLGRSGTEKR